MHEPTPTAAPLAVTAELVATAAPQDPWPSPRIAGYALFVFAIVLMFNFLDRGILNLLVTPIKRDLGLSDVQMSLLMGFAFSLFYVLLGLPIARLVDSRSRRLIMGTGIAIWSGMTALCGLAGSFSQLFIARVGVGVGEACNGPATYSMLSDLFPREKLPRAISFLNFGFVAGTGLALVIGGLVIKLLARVPEVHLPLIGTLHSWQLVFIVVGLPGLLVAALMATMPEPKRRGVLALVQGGRAVPVKSLPVKQVVGFLVKNGPAYAPMFMGLACSSVLNFGIQAWAPTLFARAYGWSASQAGLTLGILVIVTAPIGLLAGSALAERFARQGRDDANWRVVVIAMCLHLPGAILFPLMPTPQLALGVMALNFLANFLSPGPMNAALQIITPNQMRGQVTALFLFVFNIVGFGLGPLCVAAVTDYVFRDEAKLPYAMSLVSAVAGTLAVIIMWRGLKPYGRSVAQARAWS